MFNASCNSCILQFVLSDYVSHNQMGKGSGYAGLYTSDAASKQGCGSVYTYNIVG